MISLVETLSYCCLKYKSQPLSSFNVLIGPNASGKTTFMDVVSFLSDIVSGGLEKAVNERTANFHDLVWKKSGDSFELAIEITIPDHILRKLPFKTLDQIRYEISIGMNDYNEVSILAEKGLLKRKHLIKQKQRTYFPENTATNPESILTPSKVRNVRIVLDKTPAGNGNYYKNEKGGDQKYVFKLGPHKSGLGNLPEFEALYPVTSWLKDFLLNGVQHFVLNSLFIRKPSPPGQIRHFKPDGSNLPWVAARLKEKDTERFQDWIAHLQTALPDLEDILIKEREDDRHRYIVLRYQGGMEVPSWMASDGTLRLLALTLPAYLTDFEGVYLVEEPENGIHPRTVETMIQSLSSVYNAQILLATHSPVILSVASPESVLCFAKNEEGATDIVFGSEHPELQDWKGEENLGVLFAAGVLG